MYHVICEWRLRETPNGRSFRQPLLVGFMLKRYSALEVRKDKFEDGLLSARYCTNPVLTVPGVLARIEVWIVFLPGIAYRDLVLL